MVWFSSIEPKDELLHWCQKSAWSTKVAGLVATRRSDISLMSSSCPVFSQLPWAAAAGGPLGPGAVVAWRRGEPVELRGSEVTRGHLPDLLTHSSSSPVISARPCAQTLHPQQAPVQRTWVCDITTCHVHIYMYKLHMYIDMSAVSLLTFIILKLEGKQSVFVLNYTAYCEPNNH